MNTFQLIVIPVLLALLAERLFAAARGSVPRGTALFWAAVWFAGIVAIAWPDLTSFVARSLGIDRGADLVFYSANLLMFVGFFMVYVRLRRIEAELTRLVRYIAVQNPVILDEPGVAESRGE